MCGDFVGACASLEIFDSMFLSTVFAYYGVLEMTKSTRIMAAPIEFDYSKCILRGLALYNWNLAQSLDLVLLMGMNPIYTSVLHETLTDIALESTLALESLFGSLDTPGVVVEKLSLINTKEQDYVNLVRSCGYKAEQRSDHPAAIKVYGSLQMEEDVIRVLSSYLSKVLKESIQFQRTLDQSIIHYAKNVLNNCVGQSSGRHWCGVMIGLHDFWTFYESQNFVEAVKSIELLLLFPVSEDLASVREKTRVDLGGDIVGVLGGVIVATMQSLVGCWRSGIREGIRTRAASLILYTSGVNVIIII